MKRPIIIDTDIGSDVDDAIALCYGLNVGLNIKLVTTVHGPVELRAKIARSIIEDLGYDIPVFAGESKPIKQRQVFTLGIEGEGYARNRLNEAPYNKNGVEAIVQMIHENDSVDIVALGPLTNIARAIEKDSSIISKINHIYTMGNAGVHKVSEKKEFWYLTYRAHNFKVDPEATDIVFETGLPITIFTTEVCKKNFFTQEQLDYLASLNHPVFSYLGKAGNLGKDKMGFNVAHLYDPLVMHSLVDDSFTQKKTFEPYENYGSVRITIDGKTDRINIDGEKNLMNKNLADIIWKAYFN